MTRLLATIAATWALHCVAAESWKPFAVELAPKQSHEECVHLEQGEARKYHWKSDQAVDFDIHFHQGNDAVYPVKRAGMRGDGGTFKARAAQDYCWMWTARARPAKLEGRIEVKPE
jgi:hypothetical protein